MAVRGVFASDAGITGDRKGDFASALLQIMPTGTAPLLALSSGMNSADAMDTIINWFEENHISGRVATTAGYNTTDVAIAVTDGSSFIAGNTFLVEASGEMLYVTGVATNTLTVIRGFGGTTPTLITNGGFLQRIGTAFEEGSSNPTAIANLGYPKVNYMQIFRNTWSITGTAQKVEYYTGSKTAKNKADCGMFHAEDIERALIFGKKAVGNKNNQPFRTMDGINSFITTNVTAAGATTTYNDLDTFFQGIFSKNIKGQPNERIAFCGNKALAVFNGIARIEGFIEISPGQTDFGLKVSKWITPYGDVSLMTHPLMVESPLWTKDLYIYHPGAIRMRYLRRTHQDNYASDGTRAGVDADYGVYTTELSVEYRAEVTGGRFTGLTQAAAVA